MARARALEWTTLSWNLIEAAGSVALGLRAHSVALAGFGAGSLIEVMASVVVLWHVHGDALREPDPARTRMSMRWIAGAFAAVGVLLVTTVGRDVLVGVAPLPSASATVFTGVTVVAMLTLALAKRSVGVALGSEPLRANARMALIDGLLAVAVLAALVLRVTLGWGWPDPVAAAVVALVAFREAAEHWRH